MLEGILKKGFAVFVIQMITRAVAFFAFVVLARILGVESIGSYAYILSLCVLLGLFVEFGTNQFLVKTVASEAESSLSFTVANIVVLKLVQFLIGITLLLFIEYKSLVEDFQLLNITLAYVFFEGLAQIGITILNGKRQFIRANKFSFCYEASRSLVLLCVLLFTQNINYVPIVYISSSIIYSIIISFFVLKEDMTFRSFIKGLYFPNLKLFSYYRATYLFFLSAIAYQLYFRIDMILLKRLSTPIELGIYSTGYKFFEVFLFVPAILSGIIFPTVVALYKNGEMAELKDYLKDLQTKAVIFISSLIVCIIAFSDLIVTTFFGSSFSGSIEVMQILFLTSFLYSFNFIYPVLFNSSGNEKYTIFIFLSGLILNVTLNYFFLPLYGAKAAAIINFVSELLITVLYYAFLKSRGLGVISFKAFTFIICCSLLTGFRIIMADTVATVYLLVFVVVIFLGILFFFRKDANPKLLLNARR